MLPALGGEHIFDFREFSFYRNLLAHRFCHFQKCASRPRWGAHFDFYRLSLPNKKNANRSRLNFLRFWLPFGASWNRLVSSWGQLGTNLGQLEANLGQLGANLSHLEPNFGQLEPACRPLWANFALTWAILGRTCSRRTSKFIVFPWFSDVFALSAFTPYWN